MHWIIQCFFSVVCGSCLRALLDRLDQTAPYDFTRVAYLRDVTR